jgi:hypothetical protein
VIATQGLGTVSADWHLAETGNFNGDGNSDLLWRNDNGALGIWELNGNNVIATLGLGTVSADWHIADTADVNGDDTSDILWHNDNWRDRGAGVQRRQRDRDALGGNTEPDWNIMT